MKCRIIENKQILVTPIICAAAERPLSPLETDRQQDIGKIISLCIYTDFLLIVTVPLCNLKL